MAQFGRALRSGRRGRWFKSSHPDQCRKRRIFSKTLHSKVFLFYRRFRHSFAKSASRFLRVYAASPRFFYFEKFALLLLFPKKRKSLFGSPIRFALPPLSALFRKKRESLFASLRGFPRFLFLRCVEGAAPYNQIKNNRQKSEDFCRRVPNGAQFTLNSQAYGLLIKCSFEASYPARAERGHFGRTRFAPTLEKCNHHM